MPTILPTHYGDLQVGTLPHIEYMNVVDYTTDLQDFLFTDQILNQANVKEVDGKSFSWKVQTTSTGSAQNVGADYLDNPSQVDTLGDATAEWRFIKVDYATNKRINDLNSGRERIIDMEMAQEKAAMVSMFELLEYNAAGPSVASTDNITPWGIRTWITRQYVSAGSNVAYTADGFFGGKLSAGPTLGISDATVPRHRNWYGQYTSITDNDFVSRLKKGLRRTKFKAPTNLMPQLGGRMQRLFLATETVVAGVEDLLKASNENLGLDITRYLGTPVIQRMPLFWWPALETDTTGPCYFINMGDVIIYRQKGWWMRKTHYENYPGQHLNKADFIDSGYQLIMPNKRNSGVLATSVSNAV